MVKLLVERGDVEANSKDEDGRTLLLQAAEGGPRGRGKALIRDVLAPH